MVWHPVRREDAHMLVVDAQIHIWKNNKPTNPNHRQVTDFTADDVLKEMDEVGVDAAVIHPPGWDPNSNALAVEAARASTPTGSPSSEISRSTSRRAVG
jgi:predicted TIM-barrel fold metal-dependent hydrolase